MRVRRPTLDYSEVPLYWSHNHEFAQRWNAGSFVPAYIEPFLVKILNIAKKNIAPNRRELLEDVDIFIRQEMEHCKQHVKFNRRFYSFGYEELRPLEARFAADYDEWLASKSLRFNLAYCEGFEAMSAISVTAMFEEVGDLFDGTPQEVIDLWRWHLTEEYEHRSVVHDVYHELYGKNPITAYFYRIYGFAYAIWHLGGFTNKAARILIEKDRQAMSPQERERSLANEKLAKNVLARPALRHIFEILSPFYKPSRRRPPHGVETYLTDDYAGPGASSTQ